MKELKKSERPTLLAPLFEAGWSLDSNRDALTKKFVFVNFVEAFGWMTKCAIICEKFDHHPEWFNVYKTVEVTLTTHDVGGLSDLDFKIAGKFDEMFRSI